MCIKETKVILLFHCPSAYLLSGVV